MLKQKKFDVPIILTTTHHNQGGTEIFIYMPKRDDVFAVTTNVLDKLQLNIVEAQILTTHDGYTLDSYIVLNEHGQMVTDKNQIATINRRLQQQLAHADKAFKLSKRRTSRRLRHFNYPSKIQFRQDSRRQRTLLEIDTPDRPGLLARIGVALLQCKTRLAHAKIATLGERVEDVFMITDLHHEPITDPERLAAIEQIVRDNIDRKES